MSKKQDSFYFENFIACTQLSCQAAHLLEQAMEHFDPAQLPQKLEEIHAVEHAADEKKHLLSDALVKAFITPIEREDITLLSQCIDELTDKIEDVLIRIYYNNMKAIRPETLSLARVVVRCCEAVRDMIVEFADFKHSKKLHEHIIHINTWRKRRTACLSPACTIFIPAAPMRWKSSPAVRCIFIWKSAQTPVSMWQM